MRDGGCVLRRSATCVLLCILAACGGGSSPVPTAPTPPAQTQINRPPTISSITATPTFVVQDYGIITFNATGTDPDGDTLSYSWDMGGLTLTGATAQIGPFFSGGIRQARVTVIDGRGGSMTSDVAFIVGSMTGQWSGGILETNALPSFTMNLTQAIGLFGGTITTPLGDGQVGPTGALATINATGQITMRIKVAPFQDFTMTGQMDGTGEAIAGTVSGSGFTGQPFVLFKQ
jgi:hypothetical protein